MTQRFPEPLLLQRPVQFIESIASVPVLIVLAFLSALFPAVIFPAHGVGNARLLDLHFAYSPDQAYQHLAALGPAGRSAYSYMALTSDLIFPVMYSLALSVAIMLVLRKLLPPASRLRQLCLLPFLVVIADWCENLSLSMVTRAFPERADGIVGFASAATSLKWLLIASTLLVLLALVAFWIAKGFRSRT